jgi:hypothetical protein
MKAKRKPAAKANRGPGRLSRTALNKKLIELTELLDKQFWIVDAMVVVNRPNDFAILMEHRLRMVFGPQLDAVLQGLGNVREFAKMVCAAATRERAP